MKRITPFFFLIFSVLLFTSLSSYGQTENQRKIITNAYNLKELSDKETLYANKFAREKAAVIQYAQANNMPLQYTTKDGGFAKARKVLPDGTILYYRTHNKNAAISTRTNHINSGGITGFDVDGQNMTAYVWDAGHPLVNHQEYFDSQGNNRVFIKDANPGNEYLHFHAAHVIGTIAATGVNANAKGMAFKSEVNSYDWDNDLAEATAAAQEGMLISNHSYGYDSSILDSWYFGAYIEESAEWDELMHSAPYYLMVNSAGNDGITNYNNNPLTSGYDLLTGSKVSKNALTVANAQDALVDGNGNLVSVDLESTSSSGPTDDLRIKPDIAGNGYTVYSTGENGTTSYRTLTGTSMAAPNVAGSLLLLQEHSYNVTGNYMRAATLKGLALHTADDAGPIGPDAKWGWGLLNAKKAAETITANGNTSLVYELTLTEGQSYTIEVDADQLNNLQASVSWTDLPGTPVAYQTLNDGTPTLINDLDIRITQGSDTYYPWRLTSATTNNNSGDNHVDPYERIDISNASGTYTITVSHKGNLRGGNQDFSLIVTGIINACNAPNVPQNLQAQTVGTTAAEFMWDSTENLFELQYKKTLDTTWTTVSNLSQSSHILTELIPNTSYDVKVRSKCASSYFSAYSAEIQFKTNNILPEMDCEQGNESDDFKNKHLISETSKIADDIYITAGNTLTVKYIELNVLTSGLISSFSLSILEDSGNMPGNIVHRTQDISFVDYYNLGTSQGMTKYKIVAKVDLSFNGGIGGKKLWLQPNIKSTADVYWEITPFLNTTSQMHVNLNNSGWTAENYETVFKIHCEEQFYPKAYACNFAVVADIEPITRVVFSDVDMTSSAIINGSDAKENFLMNEINLLKGASYEMALEGNTNGNYANYFTAWIDWNQNGVWDSDEKYLIGFINNSNGIDGKQAITTILVPSTALSGKTQMRIIKNYNVFPQNPCGVYDYGQAEDYTIIVHEQPDYIYQNTVWTPTNPDGIATANDNIAIINGETSLENITSMNNLLVMKDATLNVSGIINLYGDLSINGNLIFKSNASGDGELGYVSPTSVINGEATVERYLDAVRSYRMLTSSVSTSNSIHENWQENATSRTNNPNPGYGTHITGTTTDQQNGFDATQTGNPSMFDVDIPNQAFVSIANTDRTRLEAGKPYLLYVRGDRSINLDSNTSASETTIRTKGTLITGDHLQEFNTANAGTFAMFGNPYQSTVDINTVFGSSTNVNPNNYYVYDSHVGDFGGYVTVLLPAGTNSLGSDLNQYLQAGRGAQFSTLNNGASSILFTELSKAPGSITTSSAKTTSHKEQNMITVQLYTSANFKNEKLPHDGISIVFDEMYENEITLQDAVKPFNFYENLAIDKETSHLSVEFRNLPVEGEKYQLFTNGYTHRDYLFKIQISGLENNQFYLYDNYLGTAVLLDETQQTYAFNIDLLDSESISENRFYIYVEASLNVEDYLSEIDIYPNPIINDVFYIHAPVYAGESMKITITDLTGRIILSENRTTSDSEMSFFIEQKLATGVYILQLKIGERQVNKRLIKK